MTIMPRYQTFTNQNPALPTDAFPVNPPSDPNVLAAPIVPGLILEPSDTQQTTWNVNPDTPATLTDVLENLPIVKDPALDRMAFDQMQYPNSLKAIQGYMEGHRIRVIYFESLNHKISTRSNIVDTPTNRHNIHTAFRRIDNFEMTLREPWNFDYQPASTQSMVTGTAVFYPGFNPNIGDIFLATVGDNKVGMFKITQANALSWRNNRAYEVGFYFFAYPQDEDISFLQAATVDALFFDKAAFLGDQVVLLSEDKFVDLQILRNMRKILAKYYYKQFFNTALGSFFRPVDYIYDAYIVKYMASMSELEIVKARPRQLLAQVDLTYDYTIWARMQENYNFSLGDVCSQYRLQTYKGRTYDVGLTNIANRTFLIVQPPVDDSDDIYAQYVFSTAFYSGDTVNMSTFEQFFYLALTTRQLNDSRTLINTYLNTYMQLSPFNQFYWIPVYIFMIDLCIASIERVTP